MLSEKYSNDQRTSLSGLQKIQVNLNRSEQVLYAFSLILFGLYLIRTVFNRTLYRGIWPSWYTADNLRIAVIVIIILRFVFTDLRKRFTIRQWLAIAGMEAVLVFCYISTQYDFALDVGPYMLLFAGAPIYAAIKVYAATAAYVYLIALIGAMSGSVKDLVYYRWIGDTLRIRHSLGVAYPTDCAAAWFYLLLAVWFAAGWIPPVFMAAMMAGGAFLAMTVCDARNSTICMAAAAIGVLYYIVSEASIRRRGERNIFIRTLDGLMSMAFPLFAAVTVLLAWFSPQIETLFENRDMIPILNSMIGRLKLAGQAFRQYGMSLFGTPFKMIGSGSTTFHNGSKPGYNFVDCSYCMIFVRYGILVLVVFSVLYVILCRRAVREGQRKLLVILALVALHNVTEHHYTELCYNFTLLLPLAAISPSSGSMVSKDPVRTEPGQGSGYSWKRLLCIGGIITIFWLFLPRAFSIGRTLVTFGSFSAKGRRLSYICIIAAILLGLTGVFLFAWLLAAGWRKCRRKSILLAAGLTGAVILLAGTGVWISRVFTKQTPFYEKTLTDTESVIELLSEGAKNRHYRIFADDLPELYRRRYGKAVVSEHFFTEEGLCEEEDAVIITQSSNELNVLIRSGFLYGELPGSEGIYTNSSEAADILERSGIAMSAAYTTKKEISLKKLAAKHNLETTADGGIIIDGDDPGAAEAMTGNGVDIYAGTLSVDYEIELIRTTDETGMIGVVRIQRSQAADPMMNVGFTKAYFDENGKYTANVQVDLSWDTEDLEFPVIPCPGTVLKVTRVSYGKTG